MKFLITIVISVCLFAVLSGDENIQPRSVIKFQQYGFNELTEDEKLALKKYKDDVSHYKKIYKKYSDPIFKPLETSLMRESDKKNKKITDQITTDNVIWKRISSTEWTKPPVFMLDNYVTDTVKQGFIGDCYLATVLDQTLHYKLWNLFCGLNDNNINEEGTYIIRVHHGTPQLVQVDDYIPIHSDMKTIMYCHSDKNQMCPSIAEKVMAKWAGGYSGLVYGFTAEALHALTGLPARSKETHYHLDGDKNELHNENFIPNQIQDQVFEHLLELFEKGYLLHADSLSRISTVDRDYMKRHYGIRSPHAYSIRYVLKNCNNNECIKALCIRDVQGFDDQTMHSKRMEDIIHRQNLAPNQCSDSKYERWTSFRDFIRCFKKYDYLINEKFHFFSIVHQLPISQEDSTHLIGARFSITKQQTYYFTVFQPFNRENPTKLQNVGLAIFQIINNQHVFICASDYKNLRTMYVDYTLPIGEYTVVIFSIENFNQKTDQDRMKITLQVHSLDETSLRYLGQENFDKDKYSELFSKYLEKIATHVWYYPISTSENCANPFTLYGRLKPNCVRFLRVINLNGAFYHMTNPSDDVSIVVKVTAPKDEDIYQVISGRGTITTTDVLLPRKKYLLNYWTYKNYEPGTNEHLVPNFDVTPQARSQLRLKQYNPKSENVLFTQQDFTD